VSIVRGTPHAPSVCVCSAVARLEEPCLKCCDHVFDELVKICDAGEREINRSGSPPSNPCPVPSPPR